MLTESSISIHLIEPGTVLRNRYRVVRLIGNGGMAAVYLAEDCFRDNVPIAIKVLHKDLIQDKAYVQRFIREVQIMERIDHPNVVKTFDICAEDGLVFFTMECVEGKSLHEILNERSYSSTELASIICDICHGLGAIHSAGIVHRDLKPGNILIDKNGQIKIIDFGVAREESSRLTRKDQKVGSICYIAPELWLGKTPTPAADLYSLGIMLYEIVTGNVPFEDAYPGGVMKMHLDTAVTAPKTVNSQVPDWLNNLIVRLLEKQPHKRPKNAREVIEYVSPQLSSQNPNTEQKLPAILAEQQIQKRKERRTFSFSLSATRLISEANLGNENKSSRPKAVITIPLPKHAAIVFEIEKPSRDFICFGIFLASLQIFDGVLTSLGLSRHGIQLEANPLLRSMIQQFGIVEALVIAKIFAVILVILLTILAKHLRFIRDIIGALSCLYLFAAVLPWLYILYVSSAIKTLTVP